MDQDQCFDQVRRKSVFESCSCFHSLCIIWVTRLCNFACGDPSQWFKHPGHNDSVTWMPMLMMFVDTGIRLLVSLRAVLENSQMTQEVEEVIYTHCLQWTSTEDIVRWWKNTLRIFSIPQSRLSLESTCEEGDDMPITVGESHSYSCL